MILINNKKLCCFIEKEENYLYKKKNLGKASCLNVSHAVRKHTLNSMQQECLLVSLFVLQFLSPIEAKFSQVCYFMHMLSYTKWEYWSFTKSIPFLLSQSICLFLCINLQLIMIDHGPVMTLMLLCLTLSIWPLISKKNKKHPLITYRAWNFKIKWNCQKRRTMIAFWTNRGSLLWWFILLATVNKQTWML